MHLNICSGRNSRCYSRRHCQDKNIDRISQGKHYLILITLRERTKDEIERKYQENDKFINMKYITVDIALIAKKASR